ncbi:MAG: hypothetical protein DSZ06_03470 [Sulfurospirillum sp.]|nr:MAG: hypothetical protein DSZ06_03470 [Sulfurospirillum sp.]
MNFKELKNRCEHITLLYVENDNEIRELKYSIFRDIFKSVLVAKDAQDALKIYQCNQIDLIITELFMLNMSGFDMVKKIKAIEPDVKVIAYSSFSETEYLSKFNLSEFDAYIRKPIEKEKLFSTIYDVISRERVN